MKRIALFWLATDGMTVLGHKKTLCASFADKVISQDHGCYPKTDFLSTELQNHIEKIDLSSFDILGIYATTFSFHLAKKLAEHARDSNNNICLVIGGPHINKDTLNDVLETFDYAIIGSIEAVEDILRGKKAAGLYTKIDGRLSGRGVSLPRKDIPVLNITDIPGGVHAELILSDSCPNGCGYCVSNKRSNLVPIEYYIDEIKTHKEKLARLTFYDNNPFAGANIQRTKAFFAAIAGLKGEIPNTVFYSDMALIENLDGFIDYVNRTFTSGNNSIFIGRETDTPFFRL